MSASDPADIYDPPLSPFDGQGIIKKPTTRLTCIKDPGRDLSHVGVVQIQNARHLSHFTDSDAVNTAIGARLRQHNVATADRLA